MTNISKINLKLTNLGLKKYPDMTDFKLEITNLELKKIILREEIKNL